MKTIKTSEAQGAALDYAVAICEGYSNYRLNPHKFNSDAILDKDGEVVYLKTLGYSTDWAKGCPIIEREKMYIGFNGSERVAHIDGQFFGYGEGMLIAAMRCYVSSKLGESIEVPDELAGA